MAPKSKKTRQLVALGKFLKLLLEECSNAHSLTTGMLFHTLRRKNEHVTGEGSAPPRD